MSPLAHRGQIPILEPFGTNEEEEEEEEVLQLTGVSTVQGQGSAPCTRIQTYRQAADQR